MEKRKIIIDCDPGVDDALALAYAAANLQAFELLAVTTVSGNQTVEKVTRNAVNLTEFYGLEVPVAKGASEPITRKAVYAPEVHGNTGLGYCTLPTAKKQLASGNAVTFLREVIMALPEGEQVTLVPVGPMTNIALLLKTFPEVKSRIREIIFMGGAARGGNTTPAAEFNIYVDPEAASVVFHSGIPMVMCGLDATQKCALSKNQIMKFCQSGNEVAKACGDMVGFTLDTYNKYRGEASIHDVVPLMYMLHPEIFKAEKAVLDVDCSQGVSRGSTLCDLRWWNYDAEDLKDVVLLDADKEKFQEYLITAIYELGEALEGSKGK